MYDQPPTIARPNVAELAQLETVKLNQLVVSPDQLPWVDEERTINTATVDSPHGTFRFGNAIGSSRKLAKIAQEEMVGRGNDDDRLNVVMYTAIQTIMSGNPGAIKRLKNAPERTTIYYGGLANGARIYFADIGRDTSGNRVFVKVGLCGSKNSEPRVLSTLSGKKNERVK